ncbi:MAG: glycosyltransferase family 4 protein [Thermoplasmataceae archaeon]
MKIAIIVDRIFPFYEGGYEHSIHKMSEILSTEHEVTIFTSLDTNPVVQTNNKSLKYVKLTGIHTYTGKDGAHSIKGSFLFYLILRHQVKKISGFDLIFINSIPYVLTRNVYKLMCKRNGTVVTIVHEAWHEYRMYGGFKNRLMQFVLRRQLAIISEMTDRILCHSKATMESLMENYCFQENKIVLIPDGIEPNSFNQHTLTYKDIDVISVGRLAKIKRFEDLIEALFIVKERRSNLRAAIIGNGPLKKDLLNRIRARGLNDNVTILNNVDNNQKFELLSKSKLFVLASEREGFSISTVESMYMGCVPIISIPKYKEVSGPLHYIKDGNNGVTFPVANIEKLSKNILNLLENNSLREILASNARVTAEDYTWDKIKQLILSEFRSLE